MPKSSATSHQQDVLHCQQLSDDFTLVTTADKDIRKKSIESNKENWDQDLAAAGSKGRNYKTLSQAIAAERLQLLRAIELEHSIFTLSFLLIETFFRPPVNNDSNTNVQLTSGKRKRRGGRRGSCSSSSSPADQLTATANNAHFSLPRKRIYGLSKAYKGEYATQMSLPGVSKHFDHFYHDLLNWQLVFAVVTESQGQLSYCGATKANVTTSTFATTDPHHLATELNFDALFDYEDAIAVTANLLAIARQHSDLLDGLVLCSADPDATTYVRESQSNYGGSTEFCKLIGLVETLLKVKKERIEALNSKKAEMMAAAVNSSDNGEVGNSHNILSGWFKTTSTDNADNSGNLVAITAIENQLKNLQREVNAWEELADVVEISSK